MERLTKRDKNGNAYYVEYGEYLGVHKLADYEDAEEQGRLIEFPVAIGDHVWCFPSEAEPYREMQVIGQSHKFGIKYVEVQDVVTCESVYFDTKSLGSTMFLTEEEAKAKLAEMKAQEEEGELVRLPLKYGDRVYQVCGSGEKIIEWGTVQGFKLTPDSTYIYIGDGMSINAAHLGDTLFRTLEEAETKLKEMEDKDNDNA